MPLGVPVADAADYAKLRQPASLVARSHGFARSVLKPGVGKFVDVPGTGSRATARTSVTRRRAFLAVREV